MLRMAQYEYIRTAHRFYCKNISEIARATGHSRNTIRKALINEASGYRSRQYQAFPVLGEYLELIDRWLTEDKSRPKKQRHTARRIYNRLMHEHGFKGAESTVRKYVREAKARLGINGHQAFIPLDPMVGLEIEVDWGTAHAIIGGRDTILKYCCFRSKFSGKHFLRYYPCERQQAFFDAHIEAFDFFGGIFRTVIYDNLTTAVQKILKGKARVEQSAFIRFRTFYTFEARFCNPAQGHEKGGVEGMVGFVRRNYMVPLPEAESLEALNRDMLQQCLNYGNHRLAGREETVDELFEKEKEYLIDLPSERFSNIQVLSGNADKYSTVIVDKNRYSIPYQYAGFKTKVLLYVDRLEIFTGNKRLATHDRLYGNNKWNLDPHHYLELIQQRPQAFDSARPIRQWRQEWPEELEKLLERFCEKQGHTSGVKDFISVLMLYKDHASEDVDKAVRAGLTAGISSSQSVKHILLHSEERLDTPHKPLDDWPQLPPPDISRFSILGGVL